MENPTERLHANTLEDHASFGAPNEFSEIAGIAAPPTVKNERDEGHDAEEADVGGEAEEDDDEGRSEGKEADTHFMAPGGAANHVAEEEGVALACTSASNPSCEERCESQKQHLQRPLKRLRPSTAKERISKMPPCAAGKRSSIYRGVTRHRWTGRYEAHLWDKSTWNQTQNKKGKQVYLGAYDDEEAAARAYDLAALKYWGPGTTINFPVSDYARDIDDMQNVSREDYLASLRRRSSGFSRSSKAKGVCRSHTSIRWDSHIRGNFAGIPTINGYDSFGNGGLEYGILGCPQMGLINLCHFLNWLQPPSLSGDTHSNGSKRPLNLKHMEEDCLSEEQSSQRSTTGGEDYSDATCEQQQEKDKSSRPSWSCEPYQMPTLGIRRKSRSSMSALAALSQSVMFQKMEQGLRGWRVPEQAEMRVSETATTALAEALAMDGLAELEEIENSTALHQSHEATARRICDSVQSPQEVESTSCSMDLHNSTPNMRKSSTRAGQMASCSDDHSRGDNVNMHSLLPPAPYIIDQQAAYLSDQLPGLWNAFYAPSSIGMIF